MRRGLGGQQAASRRAAGGQQAASRPGRAGHSRALILGGYYSVRPYLPPSPPVLRVTHLSKRYGAQVILDDLSFEVAQGETLVLLGPSGCGKTTLLKTLNRLVEPDAGTIEINGRDARQLPPAQLRRGLGYVIQQVGLLPHLTVAQNVGVVPGLLGRPAAETQARTAALLDRLHLPAARFGPLLPAQLSGGQQQRVGLARALAADPPIILLDEPFGALDPITRAAVRRDFRELDELRRKTMVLVTHDVGEAFELADRILLLHQGRIQQLGTPRELLRQPANDFVRQFFRAEQLGLEMRVTTLAELRPFLPAAPLGAAEGRPAPAAPASSARPLAATPPLPWAASVHEALGQLAAAPGGQLPLADWPQPISQGQLLAAFGRWLETIPTTA